MSSTFTTNFNIEMPGRGDYANTWDTPVNANYDLLDGALGETMAVTIDASNVTLTTDEATQHYAYALTGTLTGNRSLIFPNSRGYLKLITNNTTGAFDVTVKTASGNGVIVPQGSSMLVASNGTDIIPASGGSYAEAPIGSVQDFAGLTIPASMSSYWVFSYGQAVSRSTYPYCLAVLTRTTAATRTSGSPTLTSVGDTSQLGAGMAIEGTGIPSSTTILSVTSSTITMSANATSGSPTVGTCTVFPYGNGDGSTTYNLPDYRGRVLAARDDMGGSAAGRLTTAGAVINGIQLGAAGGAQTVTLDSTTIPAHTHSFSATTGTESATHTHTYSGTTSSNGAHTHTVTGANNQSSGAGGGGSATATEETRTTSSDGIHTHTYSGTSATESATHTHSVSGTSGSTGGGGAHQNTQPTIIINKIIRIL